MVLPLLRRLQPFTIAAAFAVVMLRGGNALACPDCITARSVRASIFAEGFWTNLGLISAPLVVLGVITAVLYRIGLENEARA